VTRRPSKRELEAALDELTGDESRPEFGDVTLSWQMDDGEEIAEDALVIDLTEINT
jgi:hypothetical protein